jgi:hypothetical protein
VNYNTLPTLTDEALQTVLSTTSPNSFKFNIARMHDIYRLPKNTEPTLDPLLLGEDPVIRLTKFQKTLVDEVSEFDVADEGKLSIKNKLQAYKEMYETNSTPYEIESARQDCLTDIADWLSDVIVYCRSEAMKFGIPLEDTLDAVMGSNFTKLPSDGVPIYDSNGKFLKDLSNFIPPEPAIKTILFGVKDVQRARHPYERIADIDDELAGG